MLKVSHVTKYYDDFRAVNDLSFEIKEGEIFGLLGVNGAGKTTTFRMIRTTALSSVFPPFTFLLGMMML